MRRELTSPTLSFPRENPFSRGRVFSFPPRRGTPPRARESHPPRVNSARTRRALDGRVLIRPELRGENESGTGVRTSTNHQSLLPSSFSSLLPPVASASRFAVLSSRVRSSAAANSNPPRLRSAQTFYSLRLQRHLPYNYDPCPLHSAGSSHTTYVPRASELVATAGRSLDYAPSLFHHHPTATLAHTLSFSLSFSRPSWPSSHPSSRPLRRFHHRRLCSPTLCPFAYPHRANNLCLSHR